MENKKKPSRITGKVASATFVLAFTMVLFLTMMFEVTKGFGVSYAAGETASAQTPPTTLNYSGTTFKPGSYWTFMDSPTDPKGDATLGVGDDMKATDPATNKQYDLYCIEAQNQVTGSGTYTNPTRVDSSYEVGLAWILQNSYPLNSTSKYMSGLDESTKKYVTQYAIWYYLDLNNVTYTNRNTKAASKQLTDAQREKIDRLAQGTSTQSQYAKRVVQIATAAKAYNDANKGAQKFGLNTSNVSFTRDGDNLVSNEIGTVKLYNIELMEPIYNVTVDSNVGATLVGADGKALAATNGVYSVNLSSTFKIVVPISKVEEAAKTGKVTLNINATATYNSVVYRYESTEQAPLLVGSYPESATANLTVPITKIEKIDAQTKKAVEGATLKIETESGAAVTEFTTDSNPYYISLQPGKYYLTETKAPDGYEQSAERKEFTVANDGTITDVVFTNTPKTDVPNTASNIPTYIYIIGALIIVAGAVVVYSVVKPKESK